MARKKAEKKKGAENPIETQSQLNKVVTPSNRNWQIFLFVFGFILYANTVNYDYSLDDKIVITSNQITAKGFEGIADHFSYDLMDGFWAEQYGIPVEELDKQTLVAGGRYRPLSLVTYAVEWGLFGKNPGLSHVINALLYSLIGVLLYVMLLKLFPSSGTMGWKSIPFWVTLIFLAHPLHVEVVASIKGRDEILNLLFGLMSLNYLIEYSKTESAKQLYLAALMLFISLLSKETTIAFVALGPLLLYFFKLGNAKVLKSSVIWMLGAGVLYNVIRYMVVGSPGGGEINELMNDPFLIATESQRFATIFVTLATYVKLVFIPYPLTHDYYPFHLPFLPDEQQYAAWGDLATIAGVLVLLGLLFVLFKGIKTRSVYSFAILWFFGTIVLVSNVLFPIGVFMNERFMFIPSVGIAIALAAFLTHIWNNRLKPNQHAMFFGGLGLLVVIFSGLTLNRSADWESDASLALADVQVASGSAKVNMSAADALLKTLEGETNQETRTEIINEAYVYLKKSLDIYPGYFPPLDLLGKLYYESGNYTEAIKFYGYCADRKPGNRNFPDNIFYIGNKLAQDLSYDDAILAYDKALTYYPNDTRYLLAAAEVFARYQNNPSRALIYMERAYAQAPGNIEIGEKLGITYAMLSRFPDAINILEPILVKNPQNASVMNNLGIAYYQSGNIEKGTALINQSATLDPK